MSESEYQKTISAPPILVPVNWAGWNHPMWWVLHCINEGNPFLLLECTSCVLSVSVKNFITEAIHKCCRMLASFGLIIEGSGTDTPKIVPEKASLVAQIVKEWLHQIHDMSGVWWELQLAQARNLIRERNPAVWVTGQNLPTCTTLALLLSGEVVLGDDGWPVFYRPSFGTIHAPHMDIVLTDGEDEQVRKTFNLPKATVEELERMGRQRGSDLSAVVREILFQAVCDDRERQLRLTAKHLGSRWEVGGIKPTPKGMVPGACASEERRQRVYSGHTATSDVNQLVNPFGEVDKPVKQPGSRAGTEGLAQKRFESILHDGTEPATVLTSELMILYVESTDECPPDGAPIVCSNRIALKIQTLLDCGILKCRDFEMGYAHHLRSTSSPMSDRMYIQVPMRMASIMVRVLKESAEELGLRVISFLPSFPDENSQDE